MSLPVVVKEVREDDEYTMGEVFGAMKEATKLHRAEMLAKADTTGWTRHTAYHFSRFFNGERVDWWPSGGKAMYRKRMVYGHKRVAALLARLTQPTEGAALAAYRKEK